MPLFTYTAKNVSGERISNTLEAESIKAAAGKLRAQGYFPLSIMLSDSRSGLEKLFSPFRKKRVSHKNIVLFTRRLADSLKGGLPLARALKVLENQTENEELSRITKELALSIQDGKSFSQALQRYPSAFSPMYTAMIQAGEAAGVLEAVLAKLADFNEKEEEIRFRINSALAYPLIMLFVGMISVIFLLSFVIPKFEIMFLDLGQALPLPTKILIVFSHILRFYWWVYVPLCVACFLAVLRWRSTGRGKIFLSSLMLKLPIFGIFLRKELISRFIRTVSILLANGVPILDALTIARNTMDNKVFAEEITKIQACVKEGQGLSKPVSQSRLFPSLVAEMIAVGEETGNLESSLTRIAEIYDREVEYAVKTMTSLLEPVIILFAGVIVCFIALSMLLPVFQISSGIR